MRTQLLFCLLAIALSSQAQKTGFSYFSSHSGVDIKEDGKKFIYTIGEPINNYSYTTERTAPEIGIAQQGLGA